MLYHWSCFSCLSRICFSWHVFKRLRFAWWSRIMCHCMYNCWKVHLFWTTSPPAIASLRIPCLSNHSSADSILFSFISTIAKGSLEQIPPMLLLESMIFCKGVSLREDQGRTRIYWFFHLVISPVLAAKLPSIVCWSKASLYASIETETLSIIAFIRPWFVPLNSCHNWTHRCGHEFSRHGFLACIFWVHQTDVWIKEGCKPIVQRNCWITRFNVCWTIGHSLFCPNFLLAVRTCFNPADHFPQMIYFNVLLHSKNSHKMYELEL